jgi:Flp pilus assembly protein TadD
MYLPLMAVVVVAVIASALAWDRVKKRWLDRRTLTTRAAGWASALALVCVSAALAAGTVARNREYASGVSLARTVVERRPTSVAHHLLGIQLEAAGDHEEAVRQFREAVPGDSRARYNLGIALFNDGQLDEAIAQLQAFVGTWGLPYRLVPRWLEPTSTEVIAARSLMGRAYAMKKQWAQAIEQFRVILTMSPSNVDVHGLLGDALLGQEKFEEAAGHYVEYLKSRPDDAHRLTNFGRALDGMDRVDDAILVFRRAVAIDSRNGEAERDLATVLFDRREVDEAALHARRAVALGPDDPDAHDILGRTMVLQGNQAEARTEFERALQLDPTYAQAHEDLRRLTR